MTLNVLLTPEEDAVKVAWVQTLTVPADTVNVAEVAPCGTVTVDGTLTAPLELESDTTTPPIPAAVVRVTIPVPDWPLRIVLGLTQTLLSARDGGFMVRPNVTLAPE
jgi:hypothetical protein